MKRLFSVCVAVLFVIGAVASVQAADNLVLATGGTAGTYYPFGGAMSKIWNSKIKDMNVTAQTSGASAENVRLINKKEVELALVQSDTLDYAWNATKAFKRSPLKGMSADRVLYPEIVQVVVRADSPIKTFADLKGKKVGVGAPGSGTEASYRQLLDIYGMKKEDVNSQYLSFSESAEAFKDKHIDAFIVIGRIPNSAIMDVSTQNDIRILPISADVSAKLIQKYPFLAAGEDPGQQLQGSDRGCAHRGGERGSDCRQPTQGRHGLQPDQGPVRESARTGRRPCQGQGTEPADCGAGRLHSLPSGGGEVLQGKRADEVESRLRGFLYEEVFCSEKLRTLRPFR